MEINNRIEVDGSVVIESFMQELDCLSTFRNDGLCRDVLGADFVTKMENWDHSIRKQKETPLTVAVCGEFKRGKSSLINAIFGEDIVTTNVNTETITINHLSYGEHDNVLILRGGKKMHLTDDELKCDNLKNILSQLKEKPLYLDLKRPIDMLKDVTIIDTPGLGDSLQDFAEDVEMALKQSDAVIYVYSVSYPLSIQEQCFMKTAIRDQGFSKLFLIGNYSDAFENKEDLDRLKNVTRRRIEDFLPGIEPVLLSALDERCRQMGVARPNSVIAQELERSFEEFRNDLFELLDQKRDTIIPDRVERFARAMTRDLGSDLDIVNEALNAERSDADNKLAEVEKNKSGCLDEKSKIESRISEYCSVMRGNSIGWMEEFLGRLYMDIDSLRSVPGDDIKKYYSSYCVEIIHEAISLCNAEVIKGLYDELDKISQDISKNLNINGATKTPRITIALQNNSWTAADNAAFTVNNLDSVGIRFPFMDQAYYLACFAAGVANSKKVKDGSEDLIKRIKDQFANLKNSVMTSTNESCKVLEQDAKRMIAEYYDDLLETNEKQAQLFANVAKQNEEEKEKSRRVIRELQDALDSIRSKFYSGDAIESDVEPDIENV